MLAQAQEAPVAISPDARKPRVFRIPLIPLAASTNSINTTQVNDVVAHGGDLYVLFTELRTHNTYLTRVSQAGTLLWTHALPRGTYSSIALGDDGSVFVYRIGGYKGNPIFSIYSVNLEPESLSLSWVDSVSSPVGNKHQVILVSGEQFCTAANGGIEIRAFSKSRPGQSYPIMMVPKVSAPVVYRLSNGNIVAIDRLAGDIIHLDLQRRSISRSVLISKSEEADGPVVGSKLVVPVSGVIGDEIFFLAGPFRRQSASLVQSDFSGRVKRQESLYLPSFVPALPIKIVQVGAREVGVIYSDGAVNAFAL